MSRSTVLVNGTLYDINTGLPVKQQTDTVQPAPVTAKERYPSQRVHRQLQKSHTLNRSIVKKQAPEQTPAKAARQAAPRKSPMVSKFAPHPSVPAPKARLIRDIGPSVHPVVKRAEERRSTTIAKPANPTIRPSSVLKKEAIDQALSKAPQHGSSKQAKKQGRQGRFSRALSMASMALAVLLLAGYFTYINLPNLSVRVAAAQAGINAKYPDYRPDGYRLAGVNYDTGSVSIKFAANAGPQSYTLTQQRTSWDSTAVKENYVKPNWGNDVIPYAERGLTIYAHEGNAVWVNNGILYTISGDAPLSSSQVRSIATNL